MAFDFNFLNDAGKEIPTREHCYIEFPKWWYKPPNAAEDPQQEEATTPKKGRKQPKKKGVKESKFSSMALVEKVRKRQVRHCAIPVLPVPQIAKKTLVIFIIFFDETL